MADIMDSTLPFPVCSKRNLRFSLGLSLAAFVTFIHFFLNGYMIFFSLGIFFSKEGTFTKLGVVNKVCNDSVET